MISRGSRRSWRIGKPFFRISQSAADTHELARAIKAVATLNLKPSLMSESHSLLPATCTAGEIQIVRIQRITQIVLALPQTNAGMTATQEASNSRPVKPIKAHPYSAWPARRDGRRDVYDATSAVPLSRLLPGFFGQFKV